MRKYIYLKKYIIKGLLLTFFSASISSQPIEAQELILPKPGKMIHLSPAFNPPVLKGIKVQADNPFRFEFVLDQGDPLPNPPHKGGGNKAISPPLVGGARGGDLKNEANKLIKYFLASLTIPESDLWVNLSPYEKDRIIPDAFGKTEMGRDLLAQDYILKQITASLMYPEDEVGKKFWKRVYEESARKFGNTTIPVNTFNKVWIVPEKAVVYENVKNGTAYVVESKLKVMLEEDYLLLSHQNSHPERSEGSQNPRSFVTKSVPQDDVRNTTNQIVRQIIIPQLYKEINEGQNFAQLRQVYNSLILATWYKKKLKQSILSQVYADKNKIQGVGYSKSVILSEAKDLKQDPSPTAQDDTNVETIYQNYLQSFKKGAYNYIKEELDPVTQQEVPRKYFSGGASLGSVTIDLAAANDVPQDNKILSVMQVEVARVDEAMSAKDLAARLYKSLGPKQFMQLKSIDENKLKVQFTRRSDDSKEPVLLYEYDDYSDQSNRLVALIKDILMQMDPRLDSSVLEFKANQAKDKSKDSDNKDAKIRTFLTFRARHINDISRKSYLEDLRKAVLVVKAIKEPYNVYEEIVREEIEDDEAIEETAKVKPETGEIRPLAKDEIDELVNLGPSLFYEKNHNDLKELRVEILKNLRSYGSDADVAVKMRYKGSRTKYNQLIGAIGGIKSNESPSLDILIELAQFLGFPLIAMIRYGFYIHYRNISDLHEDFIIFLIRWGQWCKAQEMSNVSVKEVLDEIHRADEKDKRKDIIKNILTDVGYSSEIIQSIEAQIDLYIDRMVVTPSKADPGTVPDAQIPLPNNEKVRQTKNKPEPKIKKPKKLPPQRNLNPAHKPSDEEIYTWVNKGILFYKTFNARSRKHLQEKYLLAMAKFSNHGEIADHYLSRFGSEISRNSILLNLHLIRSGYNAPPVRFLINLAKMMEFDVIEMLQLGFYKRYSMIDRMNMGVWEFLITWSQWCKDNKKSKSLINDLTFMLKDQKSLDNKVQFVQKFLVNEGYEQSSVDELQPQIAHDFRRRFYSQRIQLKDEVPELLRIQTHSLMDNSAALPVWGTMGNVYHNAKDLIHLGLYTVREYDKDDLINDYQDFFNTVYDHGGLEGIVTHFDDNYGRLLKSKLNMGRKDMFNMLESFLNLQSHPQSNILLAWSDILGIPPKKVFRIAYFIHFPEVLSNKNDVFLNLVRWGLLCRGDQWKDLYTTQLDLLNTEDVQEYKSSTLKKLGYTDDLINEALKIGENPQFNIDYAATSSDAAMTTIVNNSFSYWKNFLDKAFMESDMKQVLDKSAQLLRHMLYPDYHYGINIKYRGQYALSTVHDLNVFKDIGSYFRKRWRELGYPGLPNQYLARLATFYIPPEHYDEVMGRWKALTSLGPEDSVLEEMAAEWQSVFTVFHLKYFGPHAENVYGQSRFMDYDQITKSARTTLINLVKWNNNKAINAIPKAELGHKKPIIFTYRDLMKWQMAVLLDPIIYNYILAYLNVGNIYEYNTRYAGFTRWPKGWQQAAEDQLKTMFDNLNWVDEQGHKHIISDQEIDQLLTEIISTDWHQLGLRLPNEVLLRFGNQADAFGESIIPLSHVPFVEDRTFLIAADADYFDHNSSTINYFFRSPENTYEESAKASLGLLPELDFFKERFPKTVRLLEEESTNENWGQVLEHIKQKTRAKLIKHRNYFMNNLLPDDLTKEIRGMRFDDFLGRVRLKLGNEALPSVQAWLKDSYDAQLNISGRFTTITWPKATGVKIDFQGVEHKIYDAAMMGMNESDVSQINPKIIEEIVALHKSLLQKSQELAGDSDLGHVLPHYIRRISFLFRKFSTSRDQSIRKDYYDHIKKEFQSINSLIYTLQSDTIDERKKIAGRNLEPFATRRPIADELMYYATESFIAGNDFNQDFINRLHEFDKKTKPEIARLNRLIGIYYKMTTDYDAGYIDYLIYRFNIHSRGFIDHYNGFAQHLLIAPTRNIKAGIDRLSDVSKRDTLKSDLMRIKDEFNKLRSFIHMFASMENIEIQKDRAKKYLALVKTPSNYTERRAFELASLIASDDFNEDFIEKIKHFEEKFGSDIDLIERLIDQYYLNIVKKESEDNAQINPAQKTKPIDAAMSGHLKVGDKVNTPNGPGTVVSFPSPDPQFGERIEVSLENGQVVTFIGPSAKKVVLADQMHVPEPIDLHNLGDRLKFYPPLESVKEGRLYLDKKPLKMIGHGGNTYIFELGNVVLRIALRFKDEDVLNSATDFAKKYELMGKLNLGPKLIAQGTTMNGDQYIIVERIDGPSIDKLKSLTDEQIQQVLNLVRSLTEHRIYNDNFYPTSVILSPSQNKAFLVDAKDNIELRTPGQTALLYKQLFLNSVYSWKHIMLVEHINEFFNSIILKEIIFALPKGRSFDLPYLKRWFTVEEDNEIMEALNAFRKIHPGIIRKVKGKDKWVIKKEDSSQLAKRGGIDLTADKTPLEVKVDRSLTKAFGDDNGIKFHIDPAMLKDLQNAPGFTPVIISIKPLVDVRAFLGIAP